MRYIQVARVSEVQRSCDLSECNPSAARVLTRGNIQEWEFAYKKGSKESLVDPETHISILDLTSTSKAMPLVSGIYIIEFGLEYSAGVNSAPTPDPLYLTRNRDGQQLTVEHGNPIGSLNKQVDLYNKCCHMNLSANMFLHRSGTSCYR